MRERWAPIAGAVALTLLAALAAPSSAQALPNPLDAIPSLDPSGFVVDGFKALLKFIFGDHLDDLGKQLVNLLLAVPVLTDQRTFPKLNEYRGYVTGGCWGILGLSFVIAAMRYWLAGYSGGGAYEALTGFARTVGAICMLAAFPIAFDSVSRIVNAFTAALVDNQLVSGGLSHGLVGTLSTAPLTGGGIPMLITIVAIVMALVLLAVKVVVTALLAVLFILSPLAIVLWPIEELSWALRTLLSAIGALLAFPILWAACFATFAVLSPDALFSGHHGDIGTAVLSPMITLASLIIAYRLPFAVLNQAMGAGMASHGSRAVQIYRSGRSMVPRAAPARGSQAAGAASKVNPGQGTLWP